MIGHSELTDNELKRKILRKEICFGGNKKLKIYGVLACTSGKKMNRVNRVFFASEQEALKNNYRPCGHCMKNEYKKWKNESV